MNKRGYVSLLPPKTKVTGDSATMLQARAQFFDSGAYASIAAALAAAAAGAIDDAAAGGRSDLRIAEIGCGTGYYLAALAAAFPRSEVPRS